MNEHLFRKAKAARLWLIIVGSFFAFGGLMTVIIYTFGYFHRVPPDTTLVKYIPLGIGMALVGLGYLMLGFKFMLIEKKRFFYFVMMSILMLCWVVAMVLIVLHDYRWSGSHEAWVVTLEQVFIVFKISVPSFLVIGFLVFVGRKVWAVEKGIKN